MCKLKHCDLALARDHIVDRRTVAQHEFGKCSGVFTTDHDGKVWILSLDGGDQIAMVNPVLREHQRDAEQSARRINASDDLFGRKALVLELPTF